MGWTLLGGLDALNQVLLTWLGRRHGAAVEPVGGFALIGGLLELPLSMYHTFVLAERFGFNQMGWRLWVTDLLQVHLGWLGAGPAHGGVGPVADGCGWRAVVAVGLGCLDGLPTCC